MSEEEKEAIEYLEGMLNMYNNCPAPISQKALKILVNLIEKQQQDIEKLRKIINVEKVMCENMIGDVEIVCMYKRDFLRNYGDDYISKDKIKEKIKEEQKEINIIEEAQEIDNTLALCNEKAHRQTKIETYRELLKEN